MSNIKEHRAAVIARVCDGAGKASPAQRRAAFANEGLAEPPRALLDKVARHAYKVTDEDIAAVRVALSEDEMFELVVCGAIGQAARQHDAALAALTAALEES